MRWWKDRPVSRAAVLEAQRMAPLVALARAPYDPAEKHRIIDEPAPVVDAHERACRRGLAAIYNLLEHKPLPRGMKLSQHVAVEAAGGCRYAAAAVRSSVLTDAPSKGAGQAPCSPATPHLPPMPRIPSTLLRTANDISDAGRGTNILPAIVVRAGAGSNI